MILRARFFSQIDPIAEQLIQNKGSALEFILLQSWGTGVETKNIQEVSELQLWLFFVVYNFTKASR